MNGLISLLEVRPMKSSDYNFVLSNWQSSFRTSWYAGVIPNNLYYSVVKTLIDQLINRGMVTMVLCNTEDTDQLLGFISYELDSNNAYILHYIYVKPDFRNMGFAGFLTKAINLPEKYIYTHRTKFSDRNQLFAPEIARRKECRIKK